MSESAWRWGRELASAAALGAMVLSLALMTSGCEPVAVQTPATRAGQDSSQAGELRRFAFTSLAGDTVSSGSLRGRMTVLLLLATYDDASQAQARFLSTVVRKHEPRINALGIVAERPENRPLVKLFAETLNLPYPLAMGDVDTLSDSGAFAGMNQVPSLMLLDRDGREVWRHSGLVEAADLSAAIAERDPRAR